MKQSDKEFLCYLICLSWDRLDDSERIRASKIIREITDKEDDVPKVEYVNPEIISRRSKVNTEVPADDISAREDIKKWHQFNDPFVYDPDKEVDVPEAEYITREILSQRLKANAEFHGYKPVDKE